MDSSVTLPLWLFILLALFSLLLILDRILIPSVRWYLRRRVNRVINEINTRLEIQIRPFQLTRRQLLIDQLVFDDKVTDAVQAYAQENSMPLEVAQDIARKYARETVPSFNAYIYFRFGYWLAKRIARLVYRVRVGFYDHEQLAGISPDASVVFVMNHRSNMDYLLVSFLVAEKTTLSYAVGEWARIWPLQSLIRAMGAFFVKRNSGNPLYRRVLERYVHMATRAGVCQAVFLEGGLSRDGLMREPRLGFLDYMLRDYHPENDRDIVFVPVGINYDRVIEDRTLQRALDRDAEKRSPWFVLKTTLRFIARNLLLSRRDRWRRFGYASVNFSQPLSAREYCRQQGIEFSRLAHDERFVEVGKLAERLTQDIQRVIPVLPVALMARIALHKRADWSSALELKTLALAEIERLRECGAPVGISASACESVLSGALHTLQARGLLQEDNGLLRASPDGTALLSYYANSIASRDSAEG